MAEGKRDAEAAPLGVDRVQVEPTQRLSADVKARMTHEPDKELHPAGEVKDTGRPGDIDSPPMRTTRPDQPILRTIITGVGAHVPPDPDKYTPEGRPRDLA